MLSQSRWQGGDILRLVREELTPYFSSTSQIAVEGPSVVLQPDRAQTIALVLHELATNAIKYGALSRPAGTVRVRWTLNGGRLTLEWLERADQSVSPPTRNGVGTRIILASAAAIRGGEAHFDWRETGLEFRLTVPLVAAEVPRASAPGAKENVVRLQTSTSRRILLVEDEALTGMFMHDLVTELGYEVVGPVGSVEEAMELSREEGLCGALLDVNLRGYAADPVAEVLLRRGIPVALVTGYAGEHISAALSHLPVLRKPVAADAVRVLLEDMALPEVSESEPDTLRA